jgi:hypothetical protein
MEVEKTNDYPEEDPRHHALNLVKAFNDLADHVRDDLELIHDPRGKVLFETTAEILLGLARAHELFTENEGPGEEH